MEFVITLILLLAFIGTALYTRKAEVLFSLFLLSALLTVPVLMVGSSGAVFAIDLMMIVVIFRVGSLYTLPGHFFLYALNPLLLAIILCIASSYFNTLLMAATPLNLYIYTTIKFIQYLLTGILMTRMPFKKEQLVWMLGFVVTGCLIYQSVMALHLLHLFSLPGQEYWGQQGAAVKNAEPLYRFLTTDKVVMAGFSVINTFVGLMAMYLLSGKKAYTGLALFLVAFFDVIVCTSRADMIGLIAGIAVFSLILPALKLGYPVVNRAVMVSGILFSAVMVFALLVWPNWDERNQGRIMQIIQAGRLMEGPLRERTPDLQLLPTYLLEGNIEVLIGSGPGNFSSYQARGMIFKAMGDNAYLRWLGELGIFGLVVIIWWCFSMLYLFAQGLASQLPWIRLVSLGAMALLISRCVAAWSVESLWGMDSSGCYSLYLIGICYLCAGIVRRERLTDD